MAYKNDDTQRAEVLVEALTSAVDALTKAQEGESAVTISSAVSAFMGSQKTWNEQHDKRSKETLTNINKAIQSIESKLPLLPCAENKKAITDNKKALAVQEQELKDVKENVNNKINWVWGAYALTMLLLALKATFTGLS